MAEDPYVGDPMMITPMTTSALILADGNPWVIPDTTPPETVIVLSAQARGVQVDTLKQELKIGQTRAIHHPTGVPEE